MHRWTGTLNQAILEAFTTGPADGVDRLALKPRMSERAEEGLRWCGAVGVIVAGLAGGGVAWTYGSMQSAVGAQMGPQRTAAALPSHPPVNLYNDLVETREDRVEAKKTTPQLVEPPL